ncbi:T9SS type A sorting domain-containing protein [Flavobacteriales bacterium AH-315-E23]|nr:T9SS type A sorting domain-containing protein [Flavobacteriales bacterium AH-315-E23]
MINRAISVIFRLRRQALSLVLLGLLVFSNPAQSQITITSNLVTSGDTVMYRGIDNTPDTTITPGTTGLNTWDFSALLNDELDTLSFVDPASTPYASKFPTATICLANKDGYTYFRKIPAAMTIVGSALDFIGNGTLLAVQASPDLTFILFPSTYLTNYDDSAYFSEVLPAEDLNANSYDSLVIVGSFQTVVSFDAYGTMITPFDTMDVIRQRVIELLDYTVIGKKYLAGQLLYSTLLTAETSTETRYLWWSDSAGVNYPVLEMETNSLGNANTVKFAVSMNVKVNKPIVTYCHDSCDAAAAVLGADSSFTYLWTDPDTQTTSSIMDLCEGLYQVTVWDSNGSFVRIPVTVGNADEITATVLGFGASCETCANGGAEITISGGSPPYSILWDSAAAFQITTVASDLLPDTYTVSVLDDNACPKEFSAKVGLFKGVLVYPNPVDDIIIIFSRVDGKMEFQVFDLAGRLVRSIKYEESEASIGLSTLPEGHYIYRVLDETGTELKTDHFSIIRL